MQMSCSDSALETVTTATRRRRLSYFAYFSDDGF